MCSCVMVTLPCTEYDRSLSIPRGDKEAGSRQGRVEVALDESVDVIAGLTMVTR